MEKSVFKTLSEIPVQSKVQQKGQMKYISWANAWDLLKQNFPDASRQVYEDQSTGFNYFTDGRYAWVKVGVTVNGMEHIDYLPVMDFRNNALPIDKVTATDINKTIQRSTTKAIAMHGLGLSLWTGEDIPEAVTFTQEAPKQPKLISLKVGDNNWEKVINYVKENKSLGVKKLTDQLSRKYNLGAAVKNEISKILSV